MHSPNNMAGPELLPRCFGSFLEGNTHGLTEREPLVTISSPAIKQTAFYKLATSYTKEIITYTKGIFNEMYISYFNAS